MFHTSNSHPYANFYLSDMLFAPSLCTFQTHHSHITHLCLACLSWILQWTTTHTLMQIYATCLSCLWHLCCATFKLRLTLSFMLVLHLANNLNTNVTFLVCLFVVPVLDVKQNMYLHFTPLSCMFADLTRFVSLVRLLWAKLTSTWMFAFKFVHFLTEPQHEPQLNLHPCLQLPTAYLALSTQSWCQLWFALNLVCCLAATCVSSFLLLLSFAQILLFMPSTLKPWYHLLHFIHLVLAILSCTFIADLVLHL